MTTLNPTVTASTHRGPRRASLLERLVTWVVDIRSLGGEGLEATVARAVDEAFAAIHRDMRS